MDNILSLFRALTGTVTSYKDGDFSFSLHWPQNDELSDLVRAHNELGRVLLANRDGGGLVVTMICPSPTLADRQFGARHHNVD